MKPVLQKGAWERLSKLKQVEALASPGDGRLPALPLMPGKNAAERAYLRRRAAKLNDYASKFRGTTLPQRQWGAAWMFSTNLKPALREFAGGYIKTSEGVVKDRGVGAHLKRHAGAYTGTLIAPVLGTGVGALIDVARKRPNIVKTSEMEPAVSDKTAALLGLRGPVLMGSNLKSALRELAARSGRIVEFGDGGADEAVLGALTAVASADESSAQRAMLLKRGLIEMVKGQVVITERGYEMMQKAGVPPKLTPEERREEIAGTEEKRLSMFDHREHRVEFAQGQYVAGLLGVKNPVRIHKTQRFFPTNGPVRDQIAQNARKIRGIDQVKGESLRKALQPKRDKLVKSTKDIYQKQKRGAVASMNSDSQDIQGWVGSQNYYSPLARKTKEVRAAYGLT